MKADKIQPIQELAFHKEQWEINGVHFQCHQAYYEGQLLNGVDLKIKQYSGLKNTNKNYDYLQDSQEIVFCASSNLIIYNTNKRTYHQLFTIEGEVGMLRTHIEKMNNREYIIWIEDYTERHQNSKDRNNSQIHKKPSFFNQEATNKRNATLLKSIFALSDNQKSINLTEQSQSYPKKSAFGRKQAEVNNCRLKVFDYTRKRMIFDCGIKLDDKHTVKDLFFMWNRHKIVGYITEQYQTNTNYVHYQTISTDQLKDSTKQGQKSVPFQVLQTNKTFSSLIFNNQLTNYMFVHGRTLNQLVVQQQQANNEHQIFRQFLNFTQKAEQTSNKTVRLSIEEICQFDQSILALSLNDQYLAIMTEQKIYFHSVFDPTTLIFTYQFESAKHQPLNLYFNKSTLVLTFKNISSIFSYTIKSKVLKFVNQTPLQLKNCKQILSVYCNNISSQVFCVALFYEQSLQYSLGSQLIQNLVQYTMKPAYIDIATTFLTSSSKGEVSLLGVSENRFKKIHTCPWLSSQIIETEDAITFKEWKQTFQNKKCVSIHPTGLFLVVCFKQSFKIYIITLQGFVNTYRGDSIKDIQSCCISLQGNHLAISSSNNIYIYDFYSCIKIRTIALSFGITIESMEYMGYNLLCHLKNKKAYLYDSLNEYKQRYNFNPKNYNNQTNKEERSSTTLQLNNQLANRPIFGYIFYDPILNFFIYSYGNLVYFFNCVTQTVHAIVELSPLSYIYYNPNLSTLFLGTENGEIICFSWPNKPINLQNQQVRFKLHRGRIIDIKVTSDLKELITIAEDESLCKCSLYFIQNLKRYEGLQLVEYLSSNIKICYDFLSRKGIYQYTHNKFNSKVDTLKDYEEQVININFILPEERQKQKEQMLTNVKHNMKEIAQGSNSIYKQINSTTNEARDIISKLYNQFCQFQSNKSRQKEELRQKLFYQYMNYYNASQISAKQLQALKVKCWEEREQTKKELKKQLELSTSDYQKKYANLVKQHQTSKKNVKVQNKEELRQIDEEKKLFISQNLSSLNHIIEDINCNNGILSCKNNNIEKEIIDIKRKIQEHHQLFFRLQNNTKRLLQEQQKYEQLKALNKKNVEKEDKINLTEIQKRYVKQTQKLIEKDKQINVQLINYSKEKSILVHLEKCVEELQGNIEQLVQNILKEKKEAKEDTSKIQSAKSTYRNMLGEQIKKKKEKMSARNQLNNFICQLESTIQDIVQTRSRKRIKQLLEQKDLIYKQTQIPQQEIRIQDAEILTQIIEEKVQNIAESGKLGSTRLHLLKNARNNNTKSYRFLKTQGDVISTNQNILPQKEFLSITNRQLIGKKSKDIYVKLGAQQKQYQRIKTEQMVFKNTRKKLDLENQDLIQYYNELAVDNKKIMASLKKQEHLNRIPIKREKTLGKQQSLPTCFELYLHNKSLTNRTLRAAIPSKTYQY